MSRARRLARREERRTQARERDAATAAAAPPMTGAGGAFQVRVDIRPASGAIEPTAGVPAEPAPTSRNGDDVGRAVRAVIAWQTGTEARGDPELVARVERLFGVVLGLSGEELADAIGRAGLAVTPELRAALAGGAAELAVKARLLFGLNLPLLQAAAMNLYEVAVNAGRSASLNELNEAQS